MRLRAARLQQHHAQPTSRCRRRAPNADHYFQVGFAATAGNLAATNGTTGEIQVWFHKTGWSNYNEIGDYSFDATKPCTPTGTARRCTRTNTLVWGTEP